MTENDSSQQLLAVTASWTAAARAGESAREDRLFDDPWAAVLAGAEGASWLEQRSPEAVLPIVLRTRFFDDYLLRIAREDGVRQVVLLAAGLDTRAYRLDWPAGTRVFELDQGELLKRKEQVLDAAGAEPSCERHAVPADLTGEWETSLTDAGFSLDEPAIWLLEGFLFYLESGELVSLLDRVMRRATAGSYLAFDVINEATLTSPLTQPWVRMQEDLGAPWIGTLDDPKALLARRGWKAQVTQCGSPEANYDRWPFPAPGDDPAAPHLWLVRARRPWPFGEGYGPEIQRVRAAAGSGIMPPDSGPPLARPSRFGMKPPARPMGS